MNDNQAGFFARAGGNLDRLQTEVTHLQESFDELWRTVRTLQNRSTGDDPAAGDQEPGPALPWPANRVRELALASNDSMEAAAGLAAVQLLLAMRALDSDILLAKTGVAIDDSGVNTFDNMGSYDRAGIPWGAWKDSVLAVETGQAPPELVSGYLAVLHAEWAAMRKREKDGLNRCHGTPAKDITFTAHDPPRCRYSGPSAGRMLDQIMLQVRNLATMAGAQ